MSPRSECRWRPWRRYGSLGTRRDQQWRPTAARYAAISTSWKPETRSPPAVPHLDLHRTLWEASGNQMLSMIWPLVESQIFMAMNLDQATFHSPSRDAELHQRLIDVIASGDESAIFAEVHDLIGRSADQMVHLIGSAETKA